jgi:hypothetical protein
MFSTVSFTKIRYMNIIMTKVLIVITNVGFFSPSIMRLAYIVNRPYVFEHEWINHCIIIWSLGGAFFVNISPDSSYCRVVIKK